MEAHEQTPDSSQAAQAPARLAHVLVIANETVGGEKLIAAIERRRERGPIRCTVICPQNKPRSGYIIYDDSVETAASIRLELTLERLRELGIEATGEVADPDPFLAATDAIRKYHPDEIILSTYPYPRSGWLRRDLVGRIRDYAKLPIEHVVVDLKSEPTRHVLVVANETVGAQNLIQLLERESTQSPHRFTLISPQGGKEPDEAAHAKNRLNQTIRILRQAGLDVVGQVMDPDPFTSIMNALQYHPADEIIISTFPGGRSRWLRGDLITRVRKETGLPVRHIEADAAAQPELAATASGEK